MPSPQTASQKDAIELLEEIRHLMELKGENPFKIRAFEKAAQVLADSTENLKERAQQGTLTELPGIGKGISEVLTEFLLQGHSTVRDDLFKSIPAGLLELTQVPGLGPKKAQVLIDELEIHSLSELEYACRENRLLKLKGFGDKLQQKILEGLAFLKSSQGQLRICDAEPLAAALEELLAHSMKGSQISSTGELRRKMETVASLDFLVEGDAPKGILKELDVFKKKSNCKIEIKLHESKPGFFGYELARTTASPEHWEALGSPKAFAAKDEAAFYSKLDLPVIPPEMRETGEEIKLSRAKKLDQVLNEKDLKGVFHNHTTRSDGSATLEEMVVAAKKLGYSYIGISDHSQSAFYAQGLKVPDLLEQEKEIKKIQDKHPEIRIFWGIESDILADGSLDYDHAVLKKFDFVVASIHSRFQMDRETMTQRILEALRNPYTRFLGHATGRLLLGRKGYDLDMEKVIAEAARRDVAIEINANPARLDIDWRWGECLRENEALVSINPDAHDIEGLQDTRYGVTVARKALLPTGLVVNSRSIKEVEKWLARK